MKTLEKPTTNRKFVEFIGVTKLFADIPAVDDITLTIEEGEFFALLGGSGCGKTTLLRMLAGFENPTRGRIFLDGVDITDLPPYERPVNMMFQSYALFPHMSVERNIAYGLKHEVMTKQQRRARVDQMLDLVKLSDYRARKPHQLSGGQRQRVALARSLAKQPKVLLLDEPLGALDRKLRENTQFELSNIQQELGTTFIVVTHDQDEAMTLANRIAVMDKGRIRQVGPPRYIYEHPNSSFVADFIGSINMFPAIIKSVGAKPVADVPSLEMHLSLTDVDLGKLKIGQAVQIAIRPEKVVLFDSKPQAHDNVFEGHVESSAYFGKDSLFRISVGRNQTILVSNSNRYRRDDPGPSLQPRTPVWLTFEPNALILLET